MECEVTLLRFVSDPASAGCRRMHYADAGVQRRLKDGLQKAGIPFRAVSQQGREYVEWLQEHDTAAEKVHQEARWEAVRAGIPLNPRASFDNPALQTEFIAWLGKRGVKYDTFKLDGRDYVAWELRSDTTNLMDMFMSESTRK